MRFTAAEAILIDAAGLDLADISEIAGGALGVGADDVQVRVSLSSRPQAQSEELAPTEDEQDWGEGCEMIGSLSSIISNAYLAGAERTVHTTSMSGVLEPGSMGQFIPDDFMK